MSVYVTHYHFRLRNELQWCFWSTYLQNWQNNVAFSASECHVDTACTKCLLWEKNKTRRRSVPTKKKLIWAWASGLERYLTPASTWLFITMLSHFPTPEKRYSMLRTYSIYGTFPLMMNKILVGRKRRRKTVIALEYSSINWDIMINLVIANTNKNMQFLLVWNLKLH